MSQSVRHCLGKIYVRDNMWMGFEQWKKSTGKPPFANVADQARLFAVA